MNICFISRIRLAINIDRNERSEKEIWNISLIGGNVSISNTIEVCISMRLFELFTIYSLNVSIYRGGYDSIHWTVYIVHCTVYYVLYTIQCRMDIV